MIFNALLIALREIRRNLTRSFLTVIGIVIGVAAVVTMVTLGRGATEAVKQQISKMGSNLLVLRPGQGWGSWGAPQFSMADVKAIGDQVPGIVSHRALRPDQRPRRLSGKRPQHRRPGHHRQLLPHRQLEHRPRPLLHRRGGRRGRSGLRHRRDDPQGALRRGRGSDRLQDPRPARFPWKSSA